jgi:hypothetical protein
MASFSEGFSRGFSLVDKVMAREQEEERQKRLEAESKRHSKVMESQGQQGLELRKQEREFIENKKFNADQANMQTRMEMRQQTIDNTWTINNRNVDISSRRQDLSEEQALHSWDQFEKQQALRQQIHDTSVTKFIMDHELRDDKTRHGMGILDERLIIAQDANDRAEDANDREEWKDDYNQLNALVGNWVSEGVARSDRSDMAENASDRADDLADNTILNSELNREERELVAKLWLEDRKYKEGRDLKADEFAESNFQMKYDQFKVQNKQWYDTYAQAKEVSERQLNMREYLTDQQGQLNQANLRKMMLGIAKEANGLDETTKQQFLARTIQMDEQTGGIKGVKIDTAAEVMMLQESTGINMWAALDEKQSYENSFAAIDKGDFQSKEFVDGINNIYKNQIGKTIGGIVKRDVYADMPVNTRQDTGGEAAPGWSMMGDMKNASRWSMLGSWGGGEEEQVKNPSVNLSGGKIIGVEFTGVAPLRSDGAGGLSMNAGAMESGETMSGVPMLKTTVLKDGKVYSYDAPMTKGRGTGAKDAVAPISMQDFMKKTQGMKQVLTTIRMDQGQKNQWDSSLQGAAISKTYMDNKHGSMTTKLKNANLMGIGIDPNSVGGKRIMKASGNHTVTTPSLKSMAAWFPDTDTKGFYSSKDKIDDITRVYRSLNSVAGQLTELGYHWDFGKMSDHARAEVMTAYKSKMFQLRKSGADYRDDEMLQDWVNNISKMHAGTLDSGLGGRKTKESEKAFDFFGDWTYR